MLSFCRKYIYQTKKLFIIFLLLMIVKTVLSYIGVIISGNFIDMLVQKGSEQELIKYCSVVVCISISSLVFSVINGYLGTKLQTAQSYTMSRDIYEHIIKLPINFVERQDMAYLSQRINTDTNVCLSFFVDSYLTLYIKVFSMIVSFILILKIEYRSALVLGVLSIVYTLVYMLFRKPIYRSMRNYKEKSSIFFGSYYECMDGIGFIKRHSVKEVFIRKMDDSFQKLFKGLLSYQKVQFSMSTCDGLITTASNAFIYFFGGLAILKGDITIGLFTIILNIFGTLVSSIKFFFEYGKAYQEAKVSYNRIKELNELKTEANGTVKINDIETITVDNISFGYEQNILNNLSCKFEKGNIYYICGDNGAGKSTFLNVLIGCYLEEMQGDIFVNDVNLKSIDMEYFRKNVVGFSEQETFLVSGTIKSNLLLFNDKEEGLEKYVDNFSLLTQDWREKNDLDIEINIQQNNLSGGERQKISIIRQLILNSSVMIFDEPTANVEEKSKEMFVNTIQGIKQNKIIIVVTHDKTLIKEGDKTIYI